MPGSAPCTGSIFLYYVILGLALLVAFVTQRMRRLPIGRAWEALREDEIACRSLGINTVNTKLTAFAMGAMFGGFAGAFFAARQGFVSPRSFKFMESATILAIVVLGGMGSLVGVAVAAVVMIGGTELLREMEWLKSIFGEDFDPGPVPHAAVRPRHGADDGLASARPHRRAASRRSSSKKRRPCPATSSTRATADALESRDPILIVEHLTMRFGGLVAVNDLSFPAGRGDITALIGPNGAGKTTVFNCITGFYKPTGHASRCATARRLAQLPARAHAGLQHRRQGESRAHVPEHPPVRRHDGAGEPDGRAAQHADGASGFSVLGGPRLRRATSGPRRSGRASERYWLEQHRPRDRADDPAGDLPYGEQRRLEIARAMCTDPVLLCLDEPAAGLNPREIAELNKLLLRIRDEYRTSILLIEHDMWVVMEISDHVVVLEYGCKIADGTPEAVRSRSEGDRGLSRRRGRGREGRGKTRGAGGIDGGE